MMVGRVPSSWQQHAPSTQASASGFNGHDVPNLLRSAWATHTAKRAARAADVPVETARNWLRGRARPLAETLLRMAERDEQLAEALARRLADARRYRAAQDPRPDVPGSGAAPAREVTE